MAPQTKAMALGFLAVMLWSTVATAFSVALQQLTPAKLLLIATGVSLLFLLTVTVQQKQWHLLQRVARDSWKTSLLFGAINPFVYYLFLLEAYDRLPAQEAQAINYTWAIMLSFMAIPILKQRLRSTDILAAACCYLGVLVIATQGRITELNFEQLDGVAFALISTVIWAAYWLLNTKDPRPSTVGLTLNFICAFPLILIYCLITQDMQQWPAIGVSASIYVGLFEMGITFILWNTALKLTTKAAQIANLIFLAPIFSIFWLSQFTNETIKTTTIIGLACILAGLAVQNWRKAHST